MFNKRPAVTLCCAMMGGIILYSLLPEALPISLFVLLPAILISSHIVLAHLVPGYSRWEFLPFLLIIAATAKARSMILPCLIL